MLDGRPRKEGMSKGVLGERGGEATPLSSKSSAVVARLQREIKELKSQNVKLTEELSSVKCLYEQLVFEAPQEKFHERRVHLLKSQLSLLERQTAVQSQALQSRSHLLSDLTSLLDYILDHGHGKVDMDRDRINKRERSMGDGVGEKGVRNLAKQNVSCGFNESELVHILEKSRELRAGISRCTLVSPASLPLSHLPSSLLTQQTTTSGCDEGISEGISVSGVSSNVPILNLKYVSSLESELVQLYGNLTQLHTSLKSFPHPPTSTPPSHTSLLSPLTHHHYQLVENTSHQLAKCCHHLLTLSLLSPLCTSLPLPTPKDQPSHTNTVDSLLARLKPHIKNRKEVKSIIEEVVKSFRHKELQHKQTTSSLERELDFHKSVYQLQVNYVSSLFEAVRTGYESFEVFSQELICTPLEDILSSYSEFTCTSGDEDKLKSFLENFKQNEASLRSIVESLKAPNTQVNDDPTNSKGSGALSEYGCQFFQRLNLLEQEYR